MKRQPENGQSLVEFALVIPILLVLMMGVFDAGRAIYAYNTIASAARQGGRTAIVNQNFADIRSRASAQGVSLGIPATDPGCSGSNVPTASSGTCVQIRTPDLSADCSGDPSIGCVAVVTVKFTFNPITPLISGVFPSIAVESTTKQPIESLCTGACPIP